MQSLRGYTALYVAAEDCDPKCMDFLLSHGADPNLRVEASNKYYGGFSALDGVLCAYSARGTTSAIPDEQKKACIELLLAHGAKLNDVASKGKTPLHVAMVYCGPEVIRFLLAKGADPLAKDAKGQTTLDSIAEYGENSRMHQIREMLSSAMAARAGKSATTPAH